jgi:hypothetical protein
MPSKPWGCRSKTLSPTPEPAGYCAGDVARERGAYVWHRDWAVQAPSDRDRDRIARDSADNRPRRARRPRYRTKVWLLGSSHRAFLVRDSKGDQARPPHLPQAGVSPSPACRSKTLTPTPEPCGILRGRCRRRTSPPFAGCVDENCARNNRGARRAPIRLTLVAFSDLVLDDDVALNDRAGGGGLGNV